eukprot:Amastigsp_a25337_8.p2 type:complete len:136 gc:universal Amastigsp_a25337_8:423-16(-)
MEEQPQRRKRSEPALKRRRCRHREHVLERKRRGADDGRRLADHKRALGSPADTVVLARSKSLRDDVRLRPASDQFPLGPEHAAVEEQHPAVFVSVLRDGARVHKPQPGRSKPQRRVPVNESLDLPHSHRGPHVLR